MDGPVKQALERDRTIDITTRGRKTGQPRRKEIWFHNVEGRLYITGTPGRRDWYANLLAHPEFTFHLKQSVRADLPAVACPPWLGLARLRGTDLSRRPARPGHPNSFTALDELPPAL